MSALCCQPATETPAETTAPHDLHSELLSSWSKPLSKTCTFKDLPRLCTRIDVHTNNADHHNPTDNNAEHKQDNSTKVRISAILSTIRQLSAFFKLDSELAIQSTQLPVDAVDNPDLSLWVKSLLEAMGGDAHPVVRCLKCCNQNLLFIAIYELKIGVLKDIHIKDSRSKQSWRIRITCEEGRVQITHQRREAIVDVPGTLDWEVSMTFDGTVQTLCSTSLRLTGMSLDDSAKKEDREILSQKLSRGCLILK